jgi:hypothetical protein
MARKRKRLQVAVEGLERRESMSSWGVHVNVARGHHLPGVHVPQVATHVSVGRLVSVNVNVGRNGGWFF